jgi:hypothetical protein
MVVNLIKERAYRIILQIISPFHKDDTNRPKLKPEGGNPFMVKKSAKMERKICNVNYCPTTTKITMDRGVLD